MPWGLQFGWPKVKGVSQYLDKLFTEAGRVSPVMVMLAAHSDMVPWLLIYKREDKAMGIAGPYPTINEALLTAVQWDEPYVLMLYQNTPHPEMADLVSEIVFEKKKRGVLPVPAQCIDWVKEHEHCAPADAILVQKFTVFARKD